MRPARLPDPAAVTAARRFVLQAAGDLPARQSDAVAVMISELAMNAVQHAGTGFVVAVELADGTVRAEVSDAGQGQLTVQQPAASTPHGRGLPLVQRMSDEWGVTPAASGAGPRACPIAVSGPELQVTASGRSSASVPA